MKQEDPEILDFFHAHEAILKQYSIVEIAATLHDQFVRYQNVNGNLDFNSMKDLFEEVFTEHGKVITIDDA